jgi:hypothetical protein
MWVVECSPKRPWGIHPRVQNDQVCHRCGWTAPGPLSDARAIAEEVAAREAMARANELGWSEDTPLAA